jgi:hypothetical protein
MIVLTQKALGRGIACRHRQAEPTAWDDVVHSTNNGLDKALNQSFPVLAALPLVAGSGEGLNPARATYLCLVSQLHCRRDACLGPYSCCAGIYANEPLMLEKTLLMVDAMPCMLVISASEIKNINNAYSTRS